MELSEFNNNNFLSILLEKTFKEKNGSATKKFQC